MKWITREKPKIDRIACPWLIKNFVDNNAEFIFVPREKVLEEAVKEGAIPFDVPGVEYTHIGDQCTFDFIVTKHHLVEPAISKLAEIIRAADTDNFQASAEAAGLWAISAGLSRNIPDDHELLNIGMKMYDALYTWAKFLQQEKHTWVQQA
jgi:hypothetical protein